ncbi:hypothetical protein CHUAL_007208 [Chamberlinius hualienensis]
MFCNNESESQSKFSSRSSYTAAIMTLKSKVVIGYCDIAGAGCRTLLGANMDKFCVEYLNLKSTDGNEVLPNIQEIDGISNERQAAVIQLNHKVENVSALVINTEFDPLSIQVAVSEIVDLVRKSNVQEVIILSGIPLNLGDKYYKLMDQDKYSNWCAKCSITDPFLNNLLQFTKIEEFCTTLVVVDGKKAKLNSRASTIDGTEQNIQQLHKFLLSEVSEDFNLDTSLRLVFNRPKLDTGNNESIDMYL